MREITITTGANPLINSCCQVSEQGHFLRSNSRTYLKTIAVKTIENDTNRDNFMSADKALDYGLIDQIVSSR